MSRIKNAREIEVEEKLRRELSTFPLYHDSHWVGVVERAPEHFCIGYGPTHSRMYNEGKTHFDVEVKGTRGDVLFLTIEEDKRRKGYGKKLYTAIERVLKELGCTVVQTTPSGEGVSFWQKVGFDRSCQVGLEKSI